MTIYRTHLTLAMTVLAGSIMMAPVSVNAEEILVEGFVGPIRWVSKGQESNINGNPLIIEVAHDDELLFKGVTGTHGVETIDRKATTPEPSEDHRFVLECGENESDNQPKAVLKEICTNGSTYGKEFGAGTTLIKLSVRDNFSDDVHFRCKRHGNVMWGTIKLKN